MAKSNEAIEECLKSINDKLKDNKDEHKEIIKVLRRTADKKVDIAMFDRTLSSTTKDRILIEKKVDRLWNELVEKKENDEEFKKELAIEISEMKKAHAVKMSNVSYIVFVVTLGLTMFANKIWHFIFN